MEQPIVIVNTGNEAIIDASGLFAEYIRVTRHAWQSAEEFLEDFPPGKPCQFEIESLPLSMGNA
jgi:hypothetical protein